MSLSTIVGSPGGGLGEDADLTEPAINEVLALDETTDDFGTLDGFGDDDDDDGDDTTLICR